jgi:hypothetical protein
MSNFDYGAKAGIPAPLKEVKEHKEFSSSQKKQEDPYKSVASAHD